MQKIYTLILLLSITFAFSQSYSFDYFIEDSSVEIMSKEEPWIRDFFYNSKNNKKLYLRYYDDQLSASLYDEEKNISHFFEVNDIKGELSFKYSYTNVWENNAAKNFKDINKDDEIEVLKLDSLHFKVNIFKNTTRRKQKYSMDFYLEKSSVDFLELPMEYSRDEEIIRKIRSQLPSGFHFITKKTESINYTKKRDSKNEIVKFKNVNLTLVIPEKLNIETPFWKK